jgi:hypothetical protein
MVIGGKIALPGSISKNRYGGTGERGNKAIVSIRETDGTKDLTEYRV